MKTDELREMYLDFFESKGCVRRPSDVLVPHWDPSVLFTPAGMNQFKDHFLGRCRLEYTRATTCQKCLRTGDIDNVGRTAYHHTFFEMLGNFSFGDYFKKEAIHWAWEFLTGQKWLGLEPAMLSATVYKDDDEAYNIWADEIGLPKSQIARMEEDENFWPASAPSLGPDGVCGPCSEIYYHHPEFGEVEIWNLVFTQYNRVGDPPDNLRPLPSKNIDTGMGLERTAAVLQGVETNYHIDILRPLVEAAGAVCGISYESGSESGRRLRRIADHIRACTFAIHENVYPGANKEKYVIKRLLRRAVLDAHQMGAREPLLFELVSNVAELMRNPYPELSDTVERVGEVIKGEEDAFLRTIDGGLGRIDKIFGQMKSEGRGTVTGAEAFDMYQTHGFPPELFETLAAEHNFTFDWDGYQTEMEEHGKTSGGGIQVELFKTDPLEALKKVMHEGSEFLGYETTEVEDATVVAIIAAGKTVDREDEVNHDEPITVVLDKTPFYGEMGGQVGDSGELIGEEFRFEVIQTKVDGPFELHVGHLRDGKILLNDKVTAKLDKPRRSGIRRAHTATHLLHSALQSVLGEHAQQQGSKVDNDVLRFDFSNQKAVPAEQLAEIEDRVNRAIMENIQVAAAEMSLNEAREKGAMMLFGEKYPDAVRVVSTGDQWSELCGGTHVAATGEIGLMRIVSEESVSAGTRRITALTGEGALADIRGKETMLTETAAKLRVPAAGLGDRVESMQKEIKRLKKELENAQRESGPTPEKLLEDAVTVGDAKIVAAELECDAKLLRSLLDALRQRREPIAVMLGTRAGGKVALVAGLSVPLLEKGLDAVAWVRDTAAVVDGGGGGRPDVARAGGKKPDELPAAIAKSIELMKGMLEG